MLNLEYLRSFRIYGIAIFDVAISYLVIYLISPLLIKLFEKIKIKTTKKTWLWLMFPLSLIVHFVIGQETTLLKMFLNPTGFYAIKAVIIFMLIMAFKN